MLTPEKLARILQDPYPKIEIRGNRTLLVSSDRIMLIPDLKDHIALVAKLLEMSDEDCRNYYIARIRMRWPGTDTANLSLLENLLDSTES